MSSRNCNQPPHPGEEFEALLQRSREGDDEALGDLLQQYRNYLLLIANQDTDPGIRGKVSASDIVQESLLTAHQEFRQFQGTQEAELLAWLRQIVVNDVRQAARTFLLTEKRDANRERPLTFQSSLDPGLPDNLATPGTNAIADEEASRLEAAMQRLSPQYRQVIQWRNWQELSFVEIGRMLDRSEDAARKLWNRAILELQKHLDAGAGRSGDQIRGS